MVSISSVYLQNKNSKPNKTQIKICWGTKFINLMSNNKLNLWLHNWRVPWKKVLSKKEMRKPGEVSGLNVSYSCRCVSRVCHMIKKVIHMGQEEEQLWTCLVSQSFTEPYYEKSPLKNVSENITCVPSKLFETLWCHATCDPIHLLYFVTPALVLMQVIRRNPS